MGDFSYFSTLPKCLDKKEQEILLYEMAKLKDEYEKTGNIDTQNKYLGIREKLITHNLRMCSDFAFKYCQKHNRMKDFEDVYGECTIELVRAIDDYDQSRGVSFATMAYKYMSTRLLNLYVHSRNDALNMIDDTQILDKDEDEVEDGFFRFLSDDTDIPESFAQKEFVKDIINYIENIESDKRRLVLKMYMGLGYEREYKQIEITKVLGCSQGYVARIIADERQRLKEYIATNYSQSFPDIAKEVKHLQFETKSEKEQYLFNSFYGLHGLETKSAIELSKELGISLSGVYSIINKKSDTLSEEQKKELPIDERKNNKKHKVKYDDDFLMSILNDYYGLDNNPILSSDELLIKYRLISKKALYSIIQLAKKKFNAEEIDELNDKRKVNRDKEILERSALCYYMYKGLKGYEKTSQLGIEKKLAINRGAVARAIEYYQEYLDSLTPEEREKLLGEDVVPEQ